MTHLLLAAAVLTMRVDYYHSGNATQEHFSLDRVVSEPLAWPGDPAKAIDTTLRGKYWFDVVDEATKKVIFSRGFASMYGEWEKRPAAEQVPKGLERLKTSDVELPHARRIETQIAETGQRDQQELATFYVDRARRA